MPTKNKEKEEETEITSEKLVHAKKAPNSIANHGLMEPQLFKKYYIWTLRNFCMEVLTGSKCFYILKYYLQIETIVLQRNDLLAFQGFWVFLVIASVSACRINYGVLI